MPHTNYPSFLPTLTSSDPEASLKYSLAIFSNPHIHSLWLCWENTQLRLRTTSGKLSSGHFPPQCRLREQGLSAPSPWSSHTAPWLLFSQCHTQLAATQEHEVVTHTHTVQRGLDELKYSWVTEDSLQVSGLCISI